MSELQTCICRSPTEPCPSCYAAWYHLLHGSQSTISNTLESATTSFQTVYSRQSDDSSCTDYGIQIGQSIDRVQSAQLYAIDEAVNWTANWSVEDCPYVDSPDQHLPEVFSRVSSQSNTSTARVAPDIGNVATVSVFRDPLDATLADCNCAHEPPRDQAARHRDDYPQVQRERIGKIAIPRQMIPEQCMKERVKCGLHPCKKTFARPAELKRHVNTVHKQDKTYRCQSCDYSTNRGDKMKEHSQRWHSYSKGPSGL